MTDDRSAWGEDGRPEARLPGLWTKAGTAGGLLLAVAGLGLAAVLGRSAPARLWSAYLVAWLFYVTVALGALFFVLVQYATRAGWSVAVRRIAEHAMGTLVVLAPAGLPLAAALPRLYRWAGPGGAADPLLREKSIYLNETSFLLRAAAYLVVWTILAVSYRRASIGQDRTGSVETTARLQAASGPALLLYGASLTFAAFDWLMALEPHWSSSIFGVYVFSGAAVAGLAFLATVLSPLEGPLGGLVRAEHRHDVGKLLFGLVAFWAYIAFSQFLLIWYASLPEETAWYAHRWHGGWKTVGIALALGHFVLPFFFLLPAEAKRRSSSLALAGAWLLAMHYLDLYWIVVPGASPASAAPTALDAATCIGMGGLFLAAFALLAGRASLVPRADPRLDESLHYEGA